MIMPKQEINVIIIWIVKNDNTLSTNTVNIL